MTEDTTKKDFNSSSAPTGSMMPPIYTEEDDKGRQNQWNLSSRLLKERIIYFNGPVTDESAYLINQQLLLLQKADGKADIQLYINSPGGSVTAGLSILDVIQHLSCDVSTVGMGMCASMGSFLLAAGAKGKRYMLPNARNMVHQIAGGSQGKERDMAGSLAFSTDLNTSLHLHYRRFTDMNDEEYKLFCRMAKDDTYLNPLIAMKMGLIDGIQKPKQYGDDPSITKEFDDLMGFYQHQLDSLPNEEPDNIYDYDPNLDNYRRVRQIVESREERGANDHLAPVVAANDDKPAAKKKVAKGGPKPT